MFHFSVNIVTMWLQEIDETAIENVITQIREHYPPDSEIHEKATLTEAELKSDENCFGFIGKSVQFKS